jgi:hypothetical protein
MTRFRLHLLMVAACVAVCAAVPASAGALPKVVNPFAIEPGSFHITASVTKCTKVAPGTGKYLNDECTKMAPKAEEDEFEWITTPDYQAGAHADLTTEFNFEYEVNGEEEATFSDVKTTIVNLPVGFLGSAIAVPTCSDAQLASKSSGGGVECPADSQVGVISFVLGEPHLTNIHYTGPVYSMPSNSGVAATLGFNVAGITQILPISVRPSDTGITVTSPSIEDLGEPHDISVTVWGVPASAVHNPQRGLVVAEETGQAPHITHEGGEEANIQVKPFLTNPTSCTGHGELATMYADSWSEQFVNKKGEPEFNENGEPEVINEKGEPEKWPSASTEVLPITGCERDPFSPSLEAQPTTTSAESPSGLDATVTVPQTWEDPESLSASDLDDSKVTLPEGMTINPSSGSGLGSCGPEQYAKETASSHPGEGCPPESKIGTVEIETPLLSEKLTGAVYVATPYDNPFAEPEQGHPHGTLLALYVVARNPERGVVIKVAGKIEPNPITGQLVTTFGETPQAPFDRFVLKFRPGATAPLVSPPACGAYSAQAELTPWSGPLEPRLVSTNPFLIEHGVHEGLCPAGGTPPFNPAVLAYPTHANAGAYTPFYLKIARQDGEQEITGFSSTMPPGLTGNLNGVAKCPEADIQAAREQSGAEAETNPACPAASEVGHTIVSAGVGAVLAQTAGKVYLAGEYRGDPLSLVAVTSAKVGPFDLGTVVIRFGLKLNPTTAQVEVDAANSEPIPHIIKGIVVHVREIHVYIEREHFIINPTNCNPSTVSETITGGGANPTNSEDWSHVTATSPFQMADCANLAFTPTFTVSTNGKTNRADGASLTTRVAYPENSIGKQANIAYVKVELPKALPSRLSTLQKACTAAQFAANHAGCPAGSVVGRAVVHTPVLPVPLEGPAYFVSHGSEAFPNLVIVLQGYGLTVELVGDTFIQNGITSSTFNATPDVPFSSFELILPQQPGSALAAHGNLCAQNLVMPTTLKAQNGDMINQKTQIEVEGCPDTLTVLAKHTTNHALTLEILVPAAGTLRASGSGLSGATKSAKHREALTLKLNERHAGRLRTRVTLTFTPSTGKPRRKLAKTLHAAFR